MVLNILVHLIYKATDHLNALQLQPTTTTTTSRNQIYRQQNLTLVHPDLRQSMRHCHHPTTTSFVLPIINIISPTTSLLIPPFPFSNISWFALSY